MLLPLLKGGLYAGILCVLANGAYWLAFVKATGHHPGKYLSLPLVLSMSLLAGLAAAVIYAVMSWYSANQRVRFLVWGVGFTLLSLTGPLSTTLPDGSAVPQGFAALAIPMHLITATLCICFMLWSDKSTGERSITL